MFWYCYNCGKKNKNEDKICTNCFRERILVNPHNIDEKNELQEKNNDSILKDNISSSEPSTDVDSNCKNCEVKLEDPISESPKPNDTFTDDSKTKNKKKKSTFFYIFVTFVTSLVCYIIIANLRYKYPSAYAWTLENILFSPFFTVFCLVVAIIICVISSKKSAQKKNNENILDEEKRNIIKNKNKNKNPNPIMLVIGLVPFVLLFFNATVACFSGVTFLWSTSYGFDAFIFTLILDFIIFLPVLKCSIVLIIYYIVKKRNK